MGRFDALTQLDTKPLLHTPLSEKATPIPAAPPPTDQRASKPANPQTDLHANMQSSKPASTQTRLHANQQASKHAKMQTGKPANMQAGKQVNLQTGKQVIIEKYSSYLPHEYKKELKRIALESDREGYEVLIEAVEHYLARRKQMQ